MDTVVKGKRRGVEEVGQDGDGGDRGRKLETTQGKQKACRRRREAVKKSEAENVKNGASRPEVESTLARACAPEKGKPSS